MCLIIDWKCFPVIGIKYLFKVAENNKNWHKIVGHGTVLKWQRACILFGNIQIVILQIDAVFFFFAMKIGILEL